ncbi:hypothetical protein Zmor_025629 [Zophobas morio]|uniref:Uncharacterized protein n=1 Tax=Zophobas morio TaxID=2755281 RepID=A0AA38HS72_9CUCU|nr:hypothetical protein Zmor_025629 [Zophobas morio]
MFLVWVVFIVGLVTIAIKTLLFFKEKRERGKILEKIPAPKEQFFFGHLYIQMGDPGKVFDRMHYFARKYYPIYRFSTPYGIIVHLMEPNDIELVLSSTKHLTKDGRYKCLEKWLGTSLLISTGPVYTRQHSSQSKHKQTQAQIKAEMWTWTTTTIRLTH